MKFLIVTPAFNSGEFIRHTIESIQNQSHTDFEHFIADAESTDDSLDIIKEYPGVKFISESDNGQSDAINKSFAKFTGDILAWQNADDTYFPNTFEVVNEFMENNPDVDLVYGDYQLIDQHGEIICDVFPIEWNERLFSLGRYCPVQPTVFWRNKVWEKAGPLDLQLNYCMDVDFYSKALKNPFKIAKIPKLLGQLRVHDQSKTQNRENSRAHRQEWSKVLSHHFQYTWLDHFLFLVFYYRSRLAAYLSLLGVKRSFYQ